MIRAGGLDTVVQFQSFTTGVDSTGSPTQTWAAISGAPVWAKRMPLKGSELIESGKLTSNEVLKLKIRRDDLILPGTRVVIGSKNYNIISVSDYGRDGDMTLWCEVKA
jgi:SPP1 family predicted phage head-tail adaptor